MAYYSKYTGAEIDAKLDQIDAKADKNGVPLTVNAVNLFAAKGMVVNMKCKLVDAHFIYDDGMFQYSVQLTYGSSSIMLYYDKYNDSSSATKKFVRYMVLAEYDPSALTLKSTSTTRSYAF